MKIKSELYWLPSRVYWRVGLNRWKLPESYVPLQSAVKKEWRDFWRVSPLICESIKDWATRHPTVKYRELAPAQTITRRLPRTLEADIPSCFTTRLTAHAPARFLARLPHARLVGANGLVLLPDETGSHTFAAEAIYGKSHLVSEPAYWTPLRPGVSKKPGAFFSLLGEFSNTSNYYHWTHDALLRLYGVQELLPEGTRYLVPPRLRSYQLEGLRLLGLRDEQLVPFEGDEVWELEDLYFASLPTSGHDVPDVEHWLGETMARACGVGKVGGMRRLYLSRRHDKHARVTNDAEVMERLAAFGFELCVPGHVTVCEQIQLFRQTEAVVASTGAGLTNMLFAHPGLRVLELLEPEFARKQGYLFWSMTEALGHTYWYLQGTTVPNPSDPYHANLCVDVDALERTVRAMLRE